VADPSILSRFNVVLWRPKSPGNVGSVARAMKNMGFARLTIADPMRYDDPLFFQAESERMAWSAVDLLRSREEVPTLEEALADSVLVAGTTSNPPDGHAVLAPRALAPLLLDAAARGPVSLLLGQEDIGLTQEAMARCQVLGSIPSSEAYASLNLSQAALIFLYEIRIAALGDDRAARRGRTLVAPVEDEDSFPPTQAGMEGFFGRLTTLLDSVGFFEGTARPHMAREIRRIFNRALLTRREVKILEGIAHSLSRALPRRPGEP